MNDRSNSQLKTHLPAEHRWLSAFYAALLRLEAQIWDAALGDGATHQFYDLPMIVAGKGQGQIKQGRLIKMKSGTLNSNLWLTLAQLMGLKIDSYADSSGVISDLWT